jgi:ribosomal-protein-alanine N-acetyltransferase
VTIRLARLSPAVLQSLADGDLPAARTATGLDLTEYFISDHLTWLWRLRLTQIETDPAAADWVANAAVDATTGTVVGAAAYHGPPDANGMVELGYGTDPAHRRRGHARAMVRALLERAAAEPTVRTVRASISPANEASLATIAGLEFIKVGEQWDEQDGTEFIYERPAHS